MAVDDDHCFSELDGYKKVIESADVVLIACAAKFHPMYLKAAIEAGKHVFVEKPHGIDPAGIKVVQQAGELAKQKKLASSPACRAASTRASRRRSSAFTTGRSARSWPSKRTSSAAPTATPAARRTNANWKSSSATSTASRGSAATT